MPRAPRGLRFPIGAMSEPRTANSFAVQLADALEASWPAIARPNQLPPPGDWQVWLLLAGRGFGKTRTLAEWVCQQAGSGQAGRIALVAATAADARDVLVEGQSGILAVSPPWFRPVYEPSKRRLTWPNGVMATTFSAEEPERLRGPQHHAAVCDEDQNIVLDIQQGTALKLAGQAAAIPEILVQPPREQRQRIAVPQLRDGAKSFVERAANNAVMVDQRERFVRDELFELIFSRPGARDVPCAGFRRNMVPPVPTQGVIIDREFSRGSLDRCARREQTLDPHAFEMIAPLTSPGSRTPLSCH